MAKNDSVTVGEPPLLATAVGEAENRSFETRYQAALASPRLARNVTNFQQDWRGKRDSAIAEIEFDELRDKLKAAKTRVTDDLDGYLREFQQAAERAGATVHHAANASDVNRIVHQIAQQHNVSLIVKSKSMVSEETELNHSLAGQGIRAVETDLGEWIVQAAGQRPSHIVGPALHMSREEVADLLDTSLGKQVARDDVAAQVHTIRDELRDAFFTAGMGITGANALVAESGSVMMVTNEGNGDLCASVPPVHVVLAGIEKLVPTYDDAVTQLRVLARSSTGQRLTVYTTFITGPTPGHEMHIVLVDNGRRAMQALPEFVEALHCIRCGACANVCPAYREVGGHVFGYIYSGAIGLVITPFIHGLDKIAGPQSLCLSCNACETVCPVEIPLPRQILDVRKMVVESDGLRPAKRAVFDVYSRPISMNLLLKIGRRLQKPLAPRGKFVRAKLPVLRSQTRWRSLPALARRPLRQIYGPGKTLAARPPVIPNGAAGKTIAIFPGCMCDLLYPEQGDAIAAALRALGATVVYPGGLNCCGLPANNSGDERHARWMARQTIRALDAVRADLIVSGSASCVAMLTQDYLHLFRDQPAWLARARQLAGRVMDFTSFLDRFAQLPAGSLATATPQVITYHDSCQGLNALDLHDEPRRILRDVLGCDLRELKENTLCCGFGGSFSFEYPEVAERLMHRKLDNALATGSPMLVTDNQGCIMHLRGGCDASGHRLEVRHLAELVAERLYALALANEAVGQ